MKSTASRTLLCVTMACLAGSGCSDSRPRLDPDNPQLSAFVRLIVPQRIEILRYLTKPVSLSGGPDADGIEVLLAAYDSLGDYTKFIGTVQFELYEVRIASGDRLGERMAFWPIELNSRDALLKYWHPPPPYFRFPLSLDGSTLAPGRYVLTAQLDSPLGERLFDEYEFTHGDRQ